MGWMLQGKMKSSGLSASSSMGETGLLALQSSGALNLGPIPFLPLEIYTHVC